MVVSFIFFLLGAFLLIFQTTLLHALPEWFGRPNLLFLLIVFIATNLDLFKGAVLALLFGLLMDIFSGVFLGLHPIVYLVLFFVLQRISKHLATNEAVHQMPLVAFSYLFSASSIFIFATILAPESKIYWAWGTEILQVLILAVICIPFFHIFKWITQVFDTQGQKKNKNPFRRQKSGNRYTI